MMIDSTQALRTMREKLARFEDTVIVLASILDVEYGKRSPHYPPMLSNPELPLADGDLDGLWFGSWEATAEARKDDPRYTGEEAGR